MSGLKKVYELDALEIAVLKKATSDLGKTEFLKTFKKMQDLINRIEERVNGNPIK